MKVRVLKTLPNGTPPGMVLDMDEAQVQVFALPGVDAVEIIEAPSAATAGARRRYGRRDLQAEETADLKAR